MLIFVKKYKKENPSITGVVFQYKNDIFHIYSKQISENRYEITLHKEIKEVLKKVGIFSYKGNIFQDNKINSSWLSQLDKKIGIIELIHKLNIYNAEDHDEVFKKKLKLIERKKRELARKQKKR